MSAPARIGLAIDPDTHDLYLDSGSSLAVVNDAEAVGQHARQRLLTHEGEWFLDTTAGVTWLSEIFGKAYDPVIAEALVKAELLDTDGIEEITSFAVAFDRDLRALQLNSIDVLTDYDEVTSL